MGVSVHSVDRVIAENIRLTAPGRRVLVPVEAKAVRGASRGTEYIAWRDADKLFIRTFDSHGNGRGRPLMIPLDHVRRLLDEQ